MLHRNIKILRKAKGLSQDELAVKLHVVRQTVSKWENGLSVPDSQMLIELATVLDTSVSTLLGEDIEKTQANELKTISEKLEMINLQLAKKKENKQKFLAYLLITILFITLLITLILVKTNSTYLTWDYSKLETAYMGISIHIFEWAFIRVAPFIIIATIIKLFIIYRNKIH